MVLLRFFANILALAVIMTVVYNGTGGSLPLMVMFHWLTNLPYPWEAGVDISLMQDVLSILIAALAVGTVGPRYLGRANLSTDVTPGVPEPAVSKR